MQTKIIGFSLNSLVFCQIGKFILLKIKKKTVKNCFFYKKDKYLNNYFGNIEVFLRIVTQINLVDFDF